MLFKLSLTYSGKASASRLMHPMKVMDVTAYLQRLIVAHIEEHFTMSAAEIRRSIKEQMPFWGKLRLQNGMTIHARELVETIGRDMSYLKVSSSSSLPLMDTN
jgi:hypothetical protein